MTTVPFPILRLPDYALQKSLKHMSLLEHLSLLFVSKNTKHLITWWHSKSMFSIFWLERSLSLSCLYMHRFWSFDFNLDQSILKVYRKTSENGESTMLHLPGITSKRWIEHVVHALIQNSRVFLMLKDRGPRSYSKEICKMIGNLNISMVQFESFENPDDPLLKRFSSIEILTVTEGHIPKSILTQNFTALNFRHIKMKLDDILISNCSIIVTHSAFSDKELNILMKCWINGSNHRLEKFRFTSWKLVQNRFTEPVLFDGIDYTEWEVKYGEVKYAKSFVVERYDGREALVTLEKCVNSWSFIFTPSFS